MKVDEPTFWSIRAAHAAMTRGSLSPVELLELCLERIERYDGTLRSFITLRANGARAEARSLEAELKGSGPRGPLHGIPVAVKDLLDVAGLPTTANSRLYRGAPAVSDATVVRRLRAAGAIVLGKLHTYELAIAPPHPDDLYPPARNPWDTTCSPGGSSSGAAVAVAAGFCFGAFGTDTGGSVRHPAALSGVTGLKPTRNLISRGGVIPLAPSLDHVGPLARSIDDIAVLLDAAAGGIPPGQPFYAVATAGTIRAVRLGVPYALLRELPDIQVEVLEAYEEALGVLQARGATLHPVILPPLDQIRHCYDTILSFEAATIYRLHLRTARGRFGTRAFEKIGVGRNVSFEEYCAAQRFRAMLRLRLDDLLHEVDVIATPTVRETAPPIEALLTGGHSARQPFTALYNLTGQPSLSVPCGFDGRGLPVGLLLSGRLFSDGSLLQVAAVFQRETDWHEARPPEPPLSPPLHEGRTL